MTQIKGAARTQKQAYKHVLAEFNASRLGAMKDGSCVYEYRAKGYPPIRCGVGCLFSPAQISEIKKAKMNGRGINRLAEEFGQENIEAATGLTMSELFDLQRRHDDAYENEYFIDFAHLLHTKIK